MKEHPGKPTTLVEQPVKELYVKYTYGSVGFVATSKFIRELKTGILVEGEMFRDGELVSIERRIPKKNIICRYEV
jgi:hypothetical protein